MLVLGPGSTHLVTAANLWPRYDHIESCVAVHIQRVNYLVNTRLFAGKCTLLITRDTAFYAIILGILEKLGWTHGLDRWAGPMGWVLGLDPWAGLMDSGLLQVNIRSVPTNSVYV